MSVSESSSPSVEKPNLIRETIIYILMAAVAITTVGPFLIMLSVSLTQNIRFITFPIELIPAPITLENFQTLFARTDALRWPPSTVSMSRSYQLLGGVITSSMAGYAFARGNFWGKNVIFLLFLGILIMPDTALIVPQFVVSLATRPGQHLFGSDRTLVCLHFRYFLLRQAYLSIPRDYDDAATIDGANLWQKLVACADAAGRTHHGDIGCSPLYGQLELLFLSHDRYIQIGYAHSYRRFGHCGALRRRCRVGYGRRGARLPPDPARLCPHAALHYPRHLTQRRERLIIRMAQQRKILYLPPVGLSEDILSPEAVSILESLGTVIWNELDRNYTVMRLLELIPGAAVVVTPPGDRPQITAETRSRSPRPADRRSCRRLSQDPPGRIRP